MPCRAIFHVIDLMHYAEDYGSISRGKLRCDVIIVRFSLVLVFCCFGLIFSKMGSSAFWTSSSIRDDKGPKETVVVEVLVFSNI